MATRIGVSSLHYARMTKEDDVDTEPEWETPIAADGVMSLSINPNGSTDTLFADDSPYETAVTIGQIEVEIEKAYLTSKQQNEILGKPLHDKGAVLHCSNKPPEWIAIGFKSLKSNGNYRWTWLYKGKFQDMELSTETKGDSINWQSDTINGNFASLRYAYEDNDGRKIKPYKIDYDEDYASGGKIDNDTWFGAVVKPFTM